MAWPKKIHGGKGPKLTAEHVRTGLANPLFGTKEDRALGRLEVISDEAYFRKLERDRTIDARRYSTPERKAYLREHKKRGREKTAWAPRSKVPYTRWEEILVYLWPTSARNIAAAILRSESSVKFHRHEMRRGKVPIPSEQELADWKSGKMVFNAPGSSFPSISKRNRESALKRHNQSGVKNSPTKKGRP